MAATRKKNWHELHENEVIRGSLGGIRIREFTSCPYDIIAIFLHFHTRFLCLWIYKTVKKQHLALMTSFSFTSRQFFASSGHFLIRCILKTLEYLIINTFSLKCLAFTRKPLKCRLNCNNCYSVYNHTSYYTIGQPRSGSPTC